MHSALRRKPTRYQTEHGVLREMLHRFLVDTVQSPRGVAGCGQVVCGAVAVLDSLLAAHPVDQRGRCRSCRYPRWLGRRPPVCVVFLQAHYWLRQPTPGVQAHLASELGVAVAPPHGAGDPEATEVLTGAVR